MELIMKKLNKLIMIMTLLLSINTQSTSFANDLKLDEVTLEDIFAGEQINNEEDFINQAYESVDLINRALSERLDYKIDQRVDFLQGETELIIDHSATRVDELLLRTTLIRTNEIASLVRDVMGDNSAENNRWLANFYLEGLLFAKTIVNANYILASSTSALWDYDSNVQYLTSAQFGRKHALRLWKYSAGLQNDITKALFLVKLVSYLGSDLKNDLRRRQDGIIKSLADVYKLQKSDVSIYIVNCIEQNLSPNRAKLAQYRKAVYNVLQNIKVRY